MYIYILLGETICYTSLGFDQLKYDRSFLVQLGLIPPRGEHYLPYILVEGNVSTSHVVSRVSLEFLTLVFRIPLYGFVGPYLSYN